MVQQLSALIVQPAVEAGQYTAGANEKVAADKAMTASAREAGAAVVDTSAKINQAGDVLARLSRQYVEGYAAEQRFNQGLNQLSRGLETGKISMEGAERILVGMNKRLGFTADAAQLAARGQTVLASAVERANAQIARQATELASADAANRRLHASNQNSISAGARQAAGFNAGQQIQDIAMMSLIGQSPMTLALQQGPQLATAIQQGGGLAALGAGIASVLSTTTLLTVGITAATAATIQWFTKGKEGANGMADAIAKSDKAVRDLAEAYHLADFNAGELGKKTVLAAEAQERISRRELERQIRQAGKDIQSRTSPSDYMTFGLLGGGQEYTVDPRFAAFTQPILALRKALGEGKADFATLESIQNDIEKIAGQGYGPFRSFVDDMARMVGMEPEGIRETADVLQDIISRAAEATRRLEQLQNLNRNGRGDRVVGPNRMDAAEEAGRRVLEEQRRERDLKFQTDEERFQAELQRERARTNAERLAAAERSALAEGGDTSSAVRVRRALAEERTRQEVEARDAAIQRSQALDRTIRQQQVELGLIGQSTAEQTKLRFEFERMEELRKQAVRTGQPIDQKEVAAIRAAAEAMRDYAGAIAAANDIKGQSENIARLRLQIALVGQNSTVQAKALAQYETEVKILDLGIDRYGQLAEMMRANARESAELTAQLARQEGAWQSIAGTAEGGIDRLVDSATNGFRDIGDALQDVAKDILKTSLQLTVANPLKNWLTGADLPEMGDLKSMGGALGRLFGMSPADPASAIASALGGRQTAMMNVQAAVVNINGAGIGGSLAGGADGIFGRLLNPANGNSAAGDPVSLASGLLGLNETSNANQINSFLKAGGVNLDAASQAWCAAFVNSSLKQIGVDGSGSNVATSFLDWGKAINPADVLRGDVLVQSRGLAAGQLGGHVGFATGLSRMDGKDLQLQMLSGNTSDKVGLGWYNASDLSARRAAESVNGLGQSAKAATQGLGTFGGGLNKLGNALSQFPAAPSGGSGIGGLLGSILNPSFAGSAAYDWLSANPGGFIGLYADGTENAPPGWAWVGERGPELMRMRGGETIRSNSRSRQMMADGSGGGTNVNVVVNNAPAGTRTRERTRTGPDGRDLREIVVDIMDDHLAEGGADSVFSNRYGARPVVAPRGK